MSELFDYLFKEQRQYVIKVKASMVKALITLANRIQKEPNKQNCTHPNSLVWIDVWDKFLAMEDNPGREPLFKAIRKIQLSECEDIYYRDRMNVFLELWLEEVLQGRWKPRSPDHPNECWRVDPNIRSIGYYFLRDHYKR